MFWDQVNFRTVFKCVPIRVMLMPGYRKNIGEGIVHVEKEFGINIVHTQCLFFGSQIAHLGTFSMYEETK